MEDSRFCPQCGNARTGAFRFCRTCGFDFESQGALIGSSDKPQPSSEPLTPTPEPGSTAQMATPTGITTPALAPVAAKRPWYRGRVGLGAAVVGVIVVLGLIGQSNQPTTPTGAISPTASPPVRSETDEPSTQPTLANATIPPITPAPTVARPTATPKPPPTPAPASYAKLTKRQWQRLVKDPDAYAGDTYQIWACITQFDSATGSESFRGDASYQREDYWALYGENSYFDGDAATLDDYVTDDVVIINVTVLGAYTYETTLGGNLTVPWFYVEKIAHKGSCE